MTTFFRHFAIYRARGYTLTNALRRAWRITFHGF